MNLDSVRSLLRGFLSPFLRGNSEPHLSAQCSRLIHDCRAELVGLAVDTDDVRRSLVCALFARALELYEAVVELVEQEMLVSAQVVERALLETVFVTGAVARNEEALRLYVLEDLYLRRKLIRKAREVDSEELSVLRGEFGDDLERDLTSDIDSEGARQLKTQELARWAKLDRWYHITYAMLSLVVHAKEKDIEKYFDIGADNRIRCVRTRSSTMPPGIVLADASLFLLRAHGELAGVTGVDRDSVVEKYLGIFESLAQAGDIGWIGEVPS